jgi:hypothetical protein
MFPSMYCCTADFKLLVSLYVSGTSLGKQPIRDGRFNGSATLKVKCHQTKIQLIIIIMITHPRRFKTTTGMPDLDEPG